MPQRLSSMILRMIEQNLWSIIFMIKVEVYNIYSRNVKELIHEVFFANTNLYGYNSLDSYLVINNGITHKKSERYFSVAQGGLNKDEKR